MSRETLLDEAIAKAKEAEDWQLVEWLRMARGGESAARWYTEKLREAHRIERKLLDENAKLREELSEWERLTAGVDLPEYPITEFEPKDLERDNDKLRELVRDMFTTISWCGLDSYPSDNKKRELADRMRELGIEVEG